MQERIQDRPSNGQVRRDLVAIATQALFVGSGVIPGIYGAYKVCLVLAHAKPADPLTLPMAALLGLALIVGILVGGVAAGALWVLAMRPYLSRAEMEKWLNHGIRSAALKRLNARILRWAYQTRQ